MDFIIIILVIFIIIIILLLCCYLFFPNIFDIFISSDCDNIEYLNYENMIFNFQVGSDKLSQERLTVLSKFMFDLISNGQNINYSMVEILNNNYDKATQNWYTKNIGIPKYFILSLIENQNYVFKNNNVDKSIIDLLDKIFSSEQNIRDNLTNGYDVILYNLIYIKLQEKYPYLKQYDCHKNQDYIKKINNILNSPFELYDKWNKDGFYQDYSFIFHINIPYNIGYLRELIQDVFYIKKYNLYDIPEINLQTLLKSFEPFVYGKFIHYNSLGRGLTRYRTKNEILNTIKYLNKIFKNKFHNDINYYYKNFYKSYYFTNENKKYIMPIIGSYMWYGKKYDNYIIIGYNTYIGNELVISENDGDLMVKNSNYAQSFLFGDEDLITWYSNANTIDSKIILPGCIFNNEDSILDCRGWLINFYTEIATNIDIVIRTITNLEKKIIIYYIIDRNIKVMTINIILEDNFPTKLKFCAASVYQDSNIISYNEIGNETSIISKLRPRYVISNLPNKTIDIETKFAKNNYSQIKYEITSKDNLIFVSTHTDYKLPNITYNGNTFNYNNIFNIEHNVSDIKDFNVFEMLCITKNTQKTYIYPVDPYKDKIPNNFIIDSLYRCYLINK